MHNQIYNKMWDEIIYPFPNFSHEVWERRCYFTPYLHFIWAYNYLSRLGLKLAGVIKTDPANNIIIILTNYVVYTSVRKRYKINILYGILSINYDLIFCTADIVAPCLPYYTVMCGSSKTRRQNVDVLLRRGQNKMADILQIASLA